MGVTDIVAEDRLTPERARRARLATPAASRAPSRSPSSAAGLEAVGLTDITLTPTHAVADGMVSAIVKATKPATHGRSSTWSGTAPSCRWRAQAGCCGGDGCC